MGKLVKLLGIAIDTNLKFDKNLPNICSKANTKVTRVAKFLLFKGKRILFKAFIESQFKYVSLVWMFYGRHINDNINKPYERALRIVHNDTITSFEELLVKDKIFKINHQNVESLVIETYGAVNNLPRENLSKFSVRNYNLHYKSQLTVSSINTLSINYFGLVIWNSIPAKLREKTLFKFSNQKEKHGGQQINFEDYAKITLKT